MIKLKFTLLFVLLLNSFCTIVNSKFEMKIHYFHNEDCLGHPVETSYRYDNKTLECSTGNVIEYHPKHSPGQIHRVQSGDCVTYEHKEKAFSEQIIWSGWCEAWHSTNILLITFLILAICIAIAIGLYIFCKKNGKKLVIAKQIKNVENNV